MNEWIKPNDLGSEEDEFLNHELTILIVKRFFLNQFFLRIKKSI
jgi:hypothetical protein